MLEALGDEPLAELLVGRTPDGDLGQRLGVAGGEPQAGASSGTTSRRPPVSATMHGQPEAIASSATRPNGS